MLNSLTAPPLTADIRPLATEPACRLCGARLHRTLIDLGCFPLANRTVTADEAEQTYPLHARICDSCMLVQLPDVAPPDTLVSPRPFLSSRSVARVEQARRFALTMRQRLGLHTESLVIEIGSNDGYLLRHFQAANIPTLGIEPARNAAAVADELGIPTEVGFFSSGTAMEIAVRHGRADLVVANNVLPYVPDLFDFAAGFAGILRPNGVMTLQVPHLLALVQRVQFDAFRHDSYAYLSLLVLERVLRSVGLRVFDAERLPDHGGSLRVHACHAVSTHSARPGLKAVRQAEAFAQLDRRDFYSGFASRVTAAREEIADFMRVRGEAGRRVAAYGAAARGATLLNCCAIDTRHITCVADPDPAKHGRLLPGSRIPIVPLEALLDDPPDDIVILPWPHVAEIAAKLHPLRQKGTQFWATMPRIGRV
jgi:2-polyprenyl-3-methyl-5-hydroxy-6-metoxy-1,4-benzoquinol methylase